MSYTIRRAGQPDTGAIWELLGETVEWLRSRGSDQWSTWHTWGGPDGKVSRAISAGQVWLLLDNDILVATVTVESQGDSDFWTPTELAEPSLYVSKLAVRRAYAGRSIGYLLLEWTRDLAYRRTSDWVRLDAWRTNEELHAYYVRMGWKFVRTSEVPHRKSGALFQVRPGPLSGQLASQVCEI